MYCAEKQSSNLGPRKLSLDFLLLCVLFLQVHIIFIDTEKNSTAKKPDERVALKPLASNKRTALEAAKKEVEHIPIIQYYSSIYISNINATVAH